MSDLIFDTEPAKWQELEDLVCQAFQEMGYESRRNEDVKTVRGKVNIDVYAVKRSNPIPTIILCECKYWKKRVDQNIILSFRSICADAGAHYGIVISKEGFQSGAAATREQTNIHLLTFIEFQRTFFDERRSGIFIQLSRMCDVLMPLTLYGNNLQSIHYVSNTAEIKAKLIGVNIFQKYEIFLGDARRYTSFFIDRGKFPIVITDPRGDPHRLRKIKVESPRQYVNLAKEGYEHACRYFSLTEPSR
jgi:hypothetical protein